MPEKANDSKLKVNGNGHSQTNKTYSVSLTAQTVGVSLRQLYYWERIGIVKPIYEEFGSHSYRRYRQSDINLLLKVKHLLDSGYTLRAASQKVKENSAAALY